MAHKRAAVLGAGSWGTALGKVLADNGFETRLWGRNRDLLDSIDAQHENARYLPGIRLPDALSTSADLAAALAGAEVITIVVPSARTARSGARDRPLLPAACPSSTP
jgi:glycerol-3-phosphate dehydrogenase (NAD(P)+)